MRDSKSFFRELKNEYFSALSKWEDHFDKFDDGDVINFGSTENVEKNMELRREAERHRKRLDKFTRYWVNNDFPEKINPSIFED